MDNKEFLKLAEDKVREYLVASDEYADLNFPKFEIYVVWSVKVLQNNKGLLSSTMADGLYFEVTYDGDENEVFLDAYTKHNPEYDY